MAKFVSDLERTWIGEMFWQGGDLEISGLGYACLTGLVDGRWDDVPGFFRDSGGGKVVYCRQIIHTFSAGWSPQMC